MKRTMHRPLTVLLKEQIPSGWLLFAFWAAVVSVWAAASISGNSVAFAATAILSILFIGLLVRYLWITGKSVADLPPSSSRFSWKHGIPGTIVIIGGVMLLIFLAGVVVYPLLLLISILFVLALRIIRRDRDRLNVRVAIIGIGAGTVAGLASWAGPGFNSYTIFYLATIPFLFVAGALLLDQSALSRIRILEGDWKASLYGFAVGIVLSVPAALLNILMGAGRIDVWVDAWWEPFVAISPAITEEIWARLFLTTFLYLLFRTAAPEKPKQALAAAIIIAAIIHSLTHLPTAALLGPAGLSYLVVAFLYGVPMALLFVKRDLEHAVGYHFFIDFLRFVSASGL